jgi:superfamily I DNA/RNA helicase
VVKDAGLNFYSTLIEKPGFNQMLQAFIADLKAARIFPEAFLRSVAALGDEPRLQELGLIYEAYQARLRQGQWADNAGLGWLAVELLEKPDSDVANSWPVLLVDGFDNFTEVQLALLGALAGVVLARALAHRARAADRRHQL